MKYVLILRYVNSAIDPSTGETTESVMKIEKSIQCICLSLKHQLISGLHRHIQSILYSQKSLYIVHHSLHLKFSIEA